MSDDKKTPGIDEPPEKPVKKLAEVTKKEVAETVAFLASPAAAFSQSRAAKTRCLWPTCAARSPASSADHPSQPRRRRELRTTLTDENAIAAGAKAEMPPSTVTSGDLHVEAAFIRSINDERIELVRFLEG